MIGLQDPGPAPRAPSSSSGSRARERTAQAIDYYNTHVHRAWALSSTSRSSFNDRHNRPHLSDHLYRSNSSLELLDPAGPSLRREYGSHGSIDVIDRPIGGTSESFFAMLQDYQPAVLADQRSPGPSEYLRGKVEDVDEVSVPQSPKSRVKLTRFWGQHQQSLIKNQRQAMDDSMVNSASTSSVVCSAEAEEIARRRAFSHYDCQSLTTNLNYTSRLV